MSAPAASTIEAIRRPRSLLGFAHSVFHVITEMLTISSFVMFSSECRLRQFGRESECGVITETHLFQWPRGGECNAVDFISIADLIDADATGVENVVDLGLTRAAGVGVAPVPIGPRD